MLSGQAKSTQKVKKIYGEPCLTGRQASLRPLPDTAIFSGHRTVAAAQQFGSFVLKFIFRIYNSRTAGSFLTFF
jgi:hypothetical protein